MRIPMMKMTFFRKNEWWVIMVDIHEEDIPSIMILSKSCNPGTCKDLTGTDASANAHRDHEMVARPLPNHPPTVDWQPAVSKPGSATIRARARCCGT